MKDHTYNARIVWEGNLGDGTATYAGYGRQYRVVIDGKPDLAGTADAAFRGEKEKHNPEDHFLAAIAGCHMLSYLALCARNGVNVVAYDDGASGTLVFDGKGGGRFEEVTLRPRVTITDAAQKERATKLHHDAHELCFIASSCSVPIRVDAVVDVR